MSKFYEDIFIYNVIDNEVVDLLHLFPQSPNNKSFFEDAFFDLQEKADKVKDIIVVRCWDKNYYQVSLSDYGYNKYFKRDRASIEKFLHRGRLACAVRDYKLKNNIKTPL